MEVKSEYERTTVSLPKAITRDIEEIVVRKNKQFPNVSQFVSHIIRNEIDRIKEDEDENKIRKLKTQIEAKNKRIAILEYELEKAGIEIP